jgi:hypothetical protein
LNSFVDDFVKDYSNFLLKYKNILITLLILLIGSLGAWVESISTLADFKRTGVEVLYWEPFTWSFTSFTLTFGLIFLIAKAQSSYPLSYGLFKKNILYHFAFSIIFSMTHVVGMVYLRKAIYFMNDKSYQFGHWPTELVYEYRKDILTYFIILTGIYIYQILIKQMEGEVSLLSENETSNKYTDKVLVKKQGKEFIINLDQVTTISSGGNYIYLHCNQQVYPLRSTMAKMQDSLDPKQFIRVHRSYIANINHIKEIISPSPQEYKIITNDNNSIPLSRNYRNQFLECFNN